MSWSDVPVRSWIVLLFMFSCFVSLIWVFGFGSIPLIFLFVPLFWQVYLKKDLAPVWW